MNNQYKENKTNQIIPDFNQIFDKLPMLKDKILSKLQIDNVNWFASLDLSRNDLIFIVSALNKLEELGEYGSYQARYVTWKCPNCGIKNKGSEVLNSSSIEFVVCFGCHMQFSLEELMSWQESERKIVFADCEYCLNQSKRDDSKQHELIRYEDTICCKDCDCSGRFHKIEDLEFRILALGNNHDGGMNR